MGRLRLTNGRVRLRAPPANSLDAELPSQLLERNRRLPTAKRLPGFLNHAALLFRLFLVIFGRVDEGQNHRVELFGGRHDPPIVERADQ